MVTDGEPLPAIEEYAIVDDGVVADLDLVRVVHAASAMDTGAGAYLHPTHASVPPQSEPVAGHVSDKLGRIVLQIFDEGFQGPETGK